MRDIYIRFKDKVDLGRDHYSNNRGEKRILQNIQPVHEVGKKFILPQFAQSEQIVIAGIANIVLWPPPGRYVWEIMAITMSHNDVANRSAELYYQNGDGAIRLGHDVIVKNIETLVYPVFHDETGLTHDHIIDIGPLYVVNNIVWVVLGISGATNGKILTVNYTYRRVL